MKKHQTFSKIDEYVISGKSLAVLALLACIVSQPSEAMDISKETQKSLLEVAKRRNLSTEDIASAAKTYTPFGKKDDYICLNSGGQAGSMIVYGVPSMRILKYIATSTPESSVGFNFDEETKGLMAEGFIDGQTINWADTHHPSISETDGKYDGQFAFINDKANPRIFVIDLRDFETKQIIQNPIFRSSHGGAFVTPNTEYVIEGSQYPAPPDRSYHPITQANFNKYWRGGITFHKFDRKAGRILPDLSFTVIAPPYSQDLSDAGKGESYGFSFTNSFCTERYIGGVESGRPPFEAGCSARDTDYLHVVDWKRAEEVVAEGKVEIINGHKTISLETAAAEGVLFLIPEPKSPHGSDVSPDGRFIVVAGKLDTHATVFDIRKIKELIKNKDYASKDPYGVPVLDLQKSIHGQVELGLGPLHTQFDLRDGIAYTSLYIDSMVVKWNFKELKVLDKVSVNYNIGHLVAMQGDTQDPRGEYVIALNKLAIDRFQPVGPLHPQNHQLIDISGEKMKVIYDLPIPMGEPHYTVCVDADGVRPIATYPPGTDPTKMALSPHAVTRGSERVQRTAKGTEIFATLAEDGGIQPKQISLKQGDEVTMYVTNVETKPDHSFKLTIGGYGVLGVYPPGKTSTLKFVASRPGIFSYKATAIGASVASRDLGMITVEANPAYETKRRVRARTMAKMRERPLPAFLAQKDDIKLTPGEAAFQNYGCGGCHKIGFEAGGPDLTDVTIRRQKDWIKKWILNPEAHYDDPSIVALINRFGVKMPNQHVPPEDADLIVSYLDLQRSAVAAPAADAAAQTTASGPGEATYKKICFACHDGGVGGAPKLGDKSAWASRIAQGDTTLYKHALEGLQSKTGFMPAKGGCVDCSDDEVKAAVDFMKEHVK